MMFYICWQSIIAGASGRGTQAFPRDEARAISDDLNRQYPDIAHWIEPAERIERAEREAALDTGGE